MILPSYAKNLNRFAYGGKNRHAKIHPSRICRRNADLQFCHFRLHFTNDFETFCCFVVTFC